MDEIFGTHQKARKQDSEHWISMSDLMAGLMMVFLLISVAYMRYVQIERDKIKEVAVAYQNSQVALYEALNTEFAEELPKWDAEIDKTTLEFRFKSPDVLFDTGQITLKTNFKTILDEFFPRYLEVLNGFNKNITEVRIEGHTSRVWSGAVSPEAAYFNNMELSQGRTRAVLQYLYSMSAVTEQRDWIKSVFAAVGFSSAHPVLNAEGLEDGERSRRVSFRVVTNAELQIRKIIQE
ncbi:MULTISPECIES: OmpA/MotB family protein [Pseudomonas]|jgi:outer membrane protein OmpA-like peptidoglycan-associated protein|uniref:OmpA/MotB family protein n=1 Tax=Pseudomonas sp. Irchel s3h14 TaxID=2009179 RepID=UPI000FBF4EA6|nr:OmpA family protein [Pseudomonas sp. Irchel s3h14]